MHHLIVNLDQSGLCRLVNMGNSCYLATVIQCFAHLEVMHDYFAQPEEWKNECNWENVKGTHCEVVEAFAEVLKDLWKPDNSKVSPRAFKFTVGKFVPQFAGQSQQNAAEF
jgi:ubiquitin carboxyl-terminal hydrolase 4/11/15